MLEFFSRLVACLRLGFFSIGYKKRVAFLALVSVVVIGACLRPYFLANLSDMTMVQEGSRGEGNDDWDIWSRRMEMQDYRSIGDAFDYCEPKPNRRKVGKVMVHFDRKLGTVVATVACNFTMPVSVKKGTVHVVSKFHGRTMFDQKFKLCKAKVDTFKCPLSKGQVMRVYETFSLPKYIPKGHYTSTASVANQDGVCFVVAESNLRI
ncbi:uncharacterized protein LOC116618794 [Nematostella vectensis]|uniref:uncharacterized protein LOC116618794 n=1 Tax=Nematostella vectensis TaxID=45351 RepID=UPI0020773382|nr:uncharacterized protein LOC116618794 [Nematostella vectensis]